MKSKSKRSAMHLPLDPNRNPTQTETICWFDWIKCFSYKFLDITLISIHLLISFVLPPSALHSCWILAPSWWTANSVLVHLVFVLSKQVDLTNLLVVLQALFLQLDLILILKSELLNILCLLSKRHWLLHFFLHDNLWVPPSFSSPSFIIFVLLKHLPF